MPTKYFANDVIFIDNFYFFAEETFPAALQVINFQLPERQEKFLRLANEIMKMLINHKYSSVVAVPMQDECL